MTDATYGPKVYKNNNGDRVVVASGGEVKIESGGTITADGTQAATIADIAVDANGTAIAAAVNAILAALEGVGILADS